MKAGLSIPVLLWRSFFTTSIPQLQFEERKLHEPIHCSHEFVSQINCIFLSQLQCLPWNVRFGFGGGVAKLCVKQRRLTGLLLLDAED